MHWWLTIEFLNLPNLVRMVPQQTRPATITRHTAPVRLRLNAVQTEPNGGKSQKSFREIFFVLTLIFSA